MHVKNDLKNQFSVNSVNSSTDPTNGAYNGSEKQNYVSEAMQFCLTMVGLMLISPLFLIIGIVIKLTSPGPVFYRGLRVGKGRQVFQIYKFRTLQVGAEEKIGARLLNEHDLFYTKIGKFLKRTKLDELPQLMNVLKGEMNLVGPRPIRPIFLENLSREISQYNMRFSVKPGMTGLAQIRGGYFTNQKDKIRYELVYLKSRSVLLDLKLILLTFLKLLNQWFTLGFLYLTLFLFVSFMPENFLPSIYTYVFGLRLNLLHLLIILGGGWLLAKRIPKGKLYLYHTPLNVPMLVFFVLTLVTSCIALNPYAAFRGSLYYAVTGFMVVLLMINGETTQRFVNNATRTVAILAVVVSCLGLFELFLINHYFITQAEASLAYTVMNLPRISSTLGNPVVLSTYLVLGFPLLLCELARANTKQARDIWLICSTIVFISIILTQARIGLLALAVTGSVFFFKRSRRHFGIFLLSFALLFFVLLGVGGPRYSPRQFWLEWNQAVAKAADHISQIPIGRLLTGIGSRNSKNLISTTIPSVMAKEANEKSFPSNMHLIMMIENGIIGWSVMIWIIVAALKSFYCAYQRVKDPQLQMILWAIFSSIIGFLVSMNDFEAFFSLSIQVLFWSLLGIGITISVHFTDKRSGFTRLWRFTE